MTIFKTVPIAFELERNFSKLKLLTFKHQSTILQDKFNSLIELKIIIFP